MTDFDRLLAQTSRTFGISIPLLDEPHRHHLTLAYLLFRVADTLEDAEQIPRKERLAALKSLRDTLFDGRVAQRVGVTETWCTWPVHHAGYAELLDEFPALMATIDQLDQPTRMAILHHAGRTIEGMLRFVDSSDEDGSLRLETLSDLREYCYVVAGIVGELITELLVTPRNDPQAEQLWEQAAAFGEGLQLVNILRDARDDAQHGRIYLPARVAIEEVFELARADLRIGQDYVDALRRRQFGHGIVPFAEFPLRLAEKTLERVEDEGTGAKLGRSEVAELLLNIDGRLQSAEELPSSLRAHLPSEG